MKTNPFRSEIRALEVKIADVARILDGDLEPWDRMRWDGEQAALESRLNDMQERAQRWSEGE